MFKKDYYYRALSLFFYYVGDICSRLDYEWAGDLYQKTMSLSLKYDEKVNYWLWKEPPLDRKYDF